jgi:colanic acid/amylovoran biosynthesis glycosyltransferase
VGKILVYNTSFFDVSQTFIYHQVKALTEKWEVHLAASRFMDPHGFGLDQFETTQIERRGGLSSSLSYKLLGYNTFSMASYVKLKKIFSENNVIAVHAHFGTKGIEVLPVARWFKVPLVVSFHGADASRMLNISRYKQKLPGLFTYASAIIVSSPHMVDNLSLERWRDKVHVIPYGIDMNTFSPVALNGKAGTVKILHSGRLTPKKGVPDLIKVFQNLHQKYKNIHLNLIGDGEELEACKRLVGELNIAEHVTFLGAVPHDTVKQQMESADIFVLNSRIAPDGDMEGTPVTLLEALSMGKPIVSTRHAGIPYVIEDGVNGLLADEKNNQQLETCLDRLIDNPELRHKMSDQAVRTARQSYTVGHMQDKIRTVFERL